MLFLDENLFMVVSCVDQARIQKFLDKTKKKNRIDKKLDAESEPVTNEQEKVAKDQEKLRRKVTQLMKKQKVHQVREIVKGHDTSKTWGQEAHVKVCDFCCCKNLFWFWSVHNVISWC